MEIQQIQIKERRLRARKDLVPLEEDYRRRGRTRTRRCVGGGKEGRGDWVTYACGKEEEEGDDVNEGKTTTTTTTFT